MPENTSFTLPLTDSCYQDGMAAESRQELNKADSPGWKGEKQGGGAFVFTARGRGERNLIDYRFEE